MVGFKNGVLNAINQNFGTVANGSGEITVAGQFEIGTGNVFPLPELAPGVITSPLGTLTIGYAAPNITLDLAGGSVGADSFQVQAFTAPGTNPVLPTGLGLLTINGAAVAAAGIPVRSDSIAANALQIEIQRASQQAASAAANAGLASFDSASFTVDANGWVQILGGSVAETFQVDAFTAPGTNPVVPTGGGLVTVHGTSVPAAGIPVRTDSIAANSYQVEVQRGSQQAASASANAGLLSMDSAAFTVDANGFTTLNGGGRAFTKIVPQAFTAPGSNPVVPTGTGQLIFNSAAVAAFGTPTRTDSLAANTVQVEIQRASASAATNATAQGLASFNSAQFTVDANGFVSSLSGTAPWLDSAGGALVNHTGYFGTAAAAYTLPAGVANGDQIEIVDAVGGGVVVTAQGGNKIQIGNVASSVNGTATTTQLGDSARFTFRLVTATWYATPGVEGNWVLA